MKLEETTSKAFNRVKNKNQKKAFSRDRRKSTWPISISDDPYTDPSNYILCSSNPNTKQVDRE